MYSREYVKEKVRTLVTRMLHLEEELSSAGNDGNKGNDSDNSDNSDISLEPYGLNSIDVLELVLQLENEFKHPFEDDNLNFDSFKTLNSITDYILEQLNSGSEAAACEEGQCGPVVIGIAGGSGSGKSTLCKLICERLPMYTVKIITTDAFFLDTLPKSISPVTGLEYDDWNAPDSIDAKKLVNSVRQSVAAGKANEIIIVEGISVLYFEELRKLFSLKLFVDLDSDERMYRRIKRNTEMWKVTYEEVAAYYLEMAKYSERRYFLNTSVFADIVLNGNRLAGPGLEAVTAWILSKIVK